MRYLLDTCAFIWTAEGGPLSPAVVDAIRATDNDLFLSAASCWEIATKHSQGRLPLSGPPDQVVPRARELHGILPLPIDEESALRSGRLPWLHRDPFDRLLIAQALMHDLTIITPDSAIGQYGVKTFW